MKVMRGRGKVTKKLNREESEEAKGWWPGRFVREREGARHAVFIDEEDKEGEEEEEATYGILELIP
jgi:hypothetical protein